MKNKFIQVFLIFLLLTFFLLNNIHIYSQDSLISLQEFQQYSEEKKASYLKNTIPKFIYELKLIYYITLTEKPKDFFALWENSIKKSEEPKTDELKLKRICSLILVYTFEEKLSYIERNFSIIENANENNDEINLIKSIYYLYYTFENSNQYSESRQYILNFLLKNKMIASYFMNFTSLDKIQILITTNFEEFIDIFTDAFLISKIKAIRSEDLKKELLSKIITKRPSFISNQIQSLLMTGSNDLNSFLIYELANNYHRFKSSERQKIKTEFQKLLQFSSSEIIHKAIYFYFSKAEQSYYIEQFRVFFKKESSLIKKELVIYLLNIKNEAIYRTLLLVYINENDEWVKNRIYEQIDKHTKEEIPSPMALEFLKQFQQVQENRFILIKTRFLFYFNPDDKIKQQIRELALSSIDKNFLSEIDDIFSKYLSMERNFEIFKKAIKITINHNKNNILVNLSVIISKEPLTAEEYKKLPNYYNFLCNVLSFGLNKDTYLKITNYYLPFLNSIFEKKFTFDEKILNELYSNLEGLYSKITGSYLSYDDSTKELRKNLFLLSYYLKLDNTINIMLSKEIDKDYLKQYLSIIEKYNPRESIIRGLIRTSMKDIRLNNQIIKIIINVIEKNKSYDPFITNIDESLSKNFNIISLIKEFLEKTSLFNYIYSVNLIFLDPPQDSYDNLYNLFKFILKNNSDSNNKEEVFPYLLSFQKTRNLIYKLFIDNEIDRTKKLSIIELLASPEHSESADFLAKLLSNSDIKGSISIINTIGKMNNPIKYLLIKDFVQSNYDKKDIQLEFARSVLSSMSYELIPYIIKLTQYPDAEVKEAAYVALGYLPISDTLPVLYDEYIKSKNPEKLYKYYSNSSDELKTYWVEYLSKEMKEDKFLNFVMNGVYPLKSYQFDSVILKKILTFVKKPFYTLIVLENIKKIPSSQIEEGLILSPFLLISGDSSYSIKFLKLLSKLKQYDLAQYAILSVNLNTVNFFFSISKSFENVNYINLFDFVFQFLGKDGLVKILPSILIYSKTIGSKNSVDFFLRVHDVEESYKILFSLYPYELDFEDCKNILEKEINLLPIVLKLAENDDKIYQYFINVIFENSSVFSKDILETAFSYCKGSIPQPLFQYLILFIENEKRPEILKIGLLYLMTNIKEEYSLNEDLINIINDFLNINNPEEFLYIIEKGVNFELTSEIIDNNFGKIKLETIELLKRIIYSKSLASSRNLLYLLFLKDRKIFIQYLNSIKSNINDPYLLSRIITKIEKIDSNYFNLIVKSLISEKKKNLILKHTENSSIEEIIYNIFLKSENIDYKDFKITLDYLIKIADDKNSYNSEKSSIISSYEYVICSIILSNIDEIDKINYFNKYFEKIKISENEVFELIKDIELFKQLDNKQLKELYLLIPFIETFQNLNFMTDFYLSIIDIFKIPENYLNIILPKFDNKILANYIIQKNLNDSQLKQFIKIIPEIILLKPDSFSLFTEQEITDIYFKSKNSNFFNFFLDNSLIKADTLFFYAKTYEQKKQLANDLLKYSKLFNISEINFKQIVQQIPSKQYKNNKNKDFGVQYDFLIKLFLYNFENYSIADRYDLFKILVKIIPDYYEINKDNDILKNFDKKVLVNFYSFILLNTYLLPEKSIVAFISRYSLPVYLGFEDIIKLKDIQLIQIIDEIDEKEAEQFEYLVFIENMFILLLKLYNTPEIIENYIITLIKDNFEVSKIFWNQVIILRIPNLIYIFDKYYGGIKWEKIRDSYLKIFK